MHDMELLAKKIAVGLIIAIIPLGLMVGGLWITRHALASPQNNQQVTHQEAR